VNSPTTQLTGETVAAAPDFISLTADALGTVEDIFTEAKDAISKNVIVEGRVSGSALEMNQYQAHGLAWLATYVESLRQMLAWSRNLTEAGTYGDTESLIMGIACGEYTARRHSHAHCCRKHASGPQTTDRHHDRARRGPLGRPTWA